METPTCQLMFPQHFLFNQTSTCVSIKVSAYYGQCTPSVQHTRHGLYHVRARVGIDVINYFTPKYANETEAKFS